MSVNPAGSYRFIGMRARYTSDQVKQLLPLVWGCDPWTEQVVERSVARCQDGAGKCAHTCEVDEWGEGCLFEDGYRICVHRHGGHDQCGKCVCIDPNLIKASSDGRESDVRVTILDLQRAWHGCRFGREIREALFLYHAAGWTQEQIAVHQKAKQQVVSIRLAAGHVALASYLNRRRVK